MIKKGTYIHSKSGQKYKVFGVGRHSETLEELVVYQGLYDSEEFGPNPIWVRPKDMFEEDIEINGRVVPRFKLMEE